MDSLFVIGFFLIGLILIVVISLVISSYFSHKTKKIRDKIIGLSEAIKRRNEIDLFYKERFKELNTKNIALQFNHFNGKRTYDNFSLYSACYNYLYENEIQIKNIIGTIIANRQFKEEYEKEISESFIQTNLEVILTSKIKPKKFYKYEKEIYFSNYIKPDIDFNINLSKEYVTPAGRNSYKENMIKTFEQIFDILESVENEKVKRSSEEFRRKYERSLVSDRVRIQILNRDNLTCQVCGESKKNDSSLVLHIDHKVPIAKGGNSDLSNLWTLCKRCNLGKSDLILENIIN
ncbi:HNH endonuclease [Mesoplasma coleopterae]|uniref:HNH endonuclease n=1 Tax=Mesoplasma coleopterae TaxID=324078 RepID=A0A2K8P5S2_9MOLU|nr:HNH endonuclease signature motif containing protein [Mesoplasma coleopterae]ATZ21083.1 HNH endonuclease [Mesoplasma coleopterae]